MSALVNLYHNRIPNSRFVFKDGTDAVFTGGQFLTDDPKQISELDYEIANRHPSIYFDPENRQIDPISLDPVAQFKAKVIAEFLASQAAAIGNPNRDMGTAAAQRLVPSSSQSIAPVAAGGTGVTMFQLPPNLSKALDNAIQTADQAPQQDPDVTAGLRALSIFAGAAEVTPTEVKAVEPVVEVPADTSLNALLKPAK